MDIITIFKSDFPEIADAIGLEYLWFKGIIFLLIFFVMLRKWVRDYIEQKKLLKRDRIQNFSEALIDEKIQKNAYVIEQLFLDRYGALLEYKAIKYFLSQENPSYMIDQYISARPFLKFNDRYTHLKPQKLSGQWFPWIAYLFGALCSIFSLVGLFFLCASAMMAFKPEHFYDGHIVKYIFVSVVLFLYSWVFLRVSYGAECARNLKHVTKNE